MGHGAWGRHGAREYMALLLLCWEDSRLSADRYLTGPVLSLSAILLHFPGNSPIHSCTSPPRRSGLPSLVTATLGHVTRD